MVSCFFTHSAYFGLQGYAEFGLYSGLNVLDKRFDIDCGRIASILDEVRVFFRYGCATDSKTFQTASFDQTRGVIVLRVLEHGATGRPISRLGHVALFQQSLDVL